MSSAPAKSSGDARYASQDPFIQSTLSHTISTPNCIRSAFFQRCVKANNNFFLLFSDNCKAQLKIYIDNCAISIKYFIIIFLKRLTEFFFISTSRMTSLMICKQYDLAVNMTNSDWLKPLNLQITFVAGHFSLVTFTLFFSVKTDIIFTVLKHLHACQVVDIEQGKL